MKERMGERCAYTVIRLREHCTACVRFAKHPLITVVYPLFIRGFAADSLTPFLSAYPFCEASAEDYPSVAAYPLIRLLSVENYPSAQNEKSVGSHLRSGYLWRLKRPSRLSTEFLGTITVRTTAVPPLSRKATFTAMSGKIRGSPQDDVMPSEL